MNEENRRPFGQERGRENTLFSRGGRIGKTVGFPGVLMGGSMKFSGIVQKGGGSGRALGFPTANISFSDDSVSGVYAAKVRFGGGDYNAAVYADTKRKLLEAHILNFNDDLYGMEIEIELLEEVREDKQFADEAEAKAAIADDVQKVQEYHRVR